MYFLDFSCYLFKLFVSYIHGKYVHMHDLNFNFCGRYNYYSVYLSSRGANLQRMEKREREREQYSYTEVRMIYARHV